MMQTSRSPANDRQFFLQAINAEVRRRVEEVAQEEIATASKRVHERIKQEIAAIALRLISSYEIRDMADRLVIEVKRN